MSEISTHILDIALGKPAAGVGVKLLRLEDEAWIELADQKTDADGRCRKLISLENTATATYRIIFDIDSYYFCMNNSRLALYPDISITFNVSDVHRSYHMPLLLSPNGYTTYRGS